MKAIVTVTFLTVALSACVADTYTPDLSYADEKWSTGCQDDQYDPYGKLIEKAKCWAMVSYFQQSIDGLPIGVATIFEIDARGPRMTKNTAYDTDICDEVPIRIAVDGKRIDQLPMKDRIEAVLAGHRLVREKDRPWPYCNVYNEVTTVTGARSAYDEMVGLWASRAP